MDKRDRDREKEIFYLCRNNRRSLGMFSQEQKSAEEDRIKSEMEPEVEARIQSGIKPEIKKR